MNSIAQDIIDWLVDEDAVLVRREDVAVVDYHTFDLYLHNLYTR